MNVNNIAQTVSDVLTRVGFQILGAIVLWIVGRWLIGVTVRLANRGMARQHVDSTLAQYLLSTRSAISCRPAA